MTKNIRKVRYEGRTYEIPDIWLAGFGDPLEGIKFWHEQTLMGEEWERQHGE